ncbi:MAG: hypothetical protein PVH62_01495 [Anaerolineae bacterium]
MNNKTLIALTILLLASLACSVGGLAGGGAEETTPAPTDLEAEPTQPPSTEGEGGATEEAPPPEIAPDALSGLNSYRARSVWSWTPESGTPQSVEIQQEGTREPAALRFTMTSEGETIEWVQIGDTSWICSGGTCIQSQQSEDEFISQFGEGFLLEPSDLVPDSDYRYVGGETINGVRTRHYVLSFSPAVLMAMTQGEITEVDSEAWIADEAGLPAFTVRFTLSWRGTQEGAAGTGEYSYEVYDVNSPLTIEPPEGAGAGMPEDVPSYPGATDLTIMGENIVFSAPDDIAAVAGFYRTELAALGWTNQSDEELAGMINQTWSKAGRSLTLMISPDDGGSSVLITLQ